jgi:hypothetical protein
LQRKPGDARALNALGKLHWSAGARSAARIAFAQAAEHHPEDIAAHVNLAHALVFEGKFDDARRHYEAALQLDPHHQNANRGLAYVLSETGDEETARVHRDLGFRTPISVKPFRGDGTPVRVLLVCSSIGGNVQTTQFLDDHVFETTTVIVERVPPETSLPEHDVVFNAIGDADRCALGLDAAHALLRGSRTRIVNPPESVRATGRVPNAERLRHLPGVVAPRIVTFARSELAAPDLEQRLERSGLRFPFLLRSPGFHTGRFFERIERPAEIEGALNALPGEELLAIEYLNGRRADGKYRKYRAIIVDDELYPLHLAISTEWKIHYGNAGMGSHPEHQVEEARFLDDMEAALGTRAVRALEAIRAELGLQFGGIDFGVDAAGNVLLYEANATMNVMPPEPHEHWAAYRIAPTRRILEAAQAMLVRFGGGAP